MALRLEEYALIGDCQSAGLVGRDGSLDWLCLPRFDSPACFAALLGNQEHGRWRIAPVGHVRNVRRAYRDGTLVLQTEYEADGGVVRVVDCMPLHAEMPTETPHVLRVVEGVRGRVEMQMDLTIRFDYGSQVPWVRRIEGGILAIAGPDAVRLLTPAPMRGENFHTVAKFAVEAGQRVPFELTWFRSHRNTPPSVEPFKAIDETEAWWRRWSQKCAYEGPWRDEVIRSFVTLKALTYAPTGGLVAAPTTSLPEALGGLRNWDYRYCWLRDAAFALYALMTGGYVEEAKAWRDWLLRAAAGRPTQVQIMYGVAGERRLTEMELDWLPGYENSRPVRAGNAAYGQFQLDVFGQVMDALHFARRAGLDPEQEAWEVQKALLDFAESCWREPDEGIWEVRGPRRHFTYSKVMAWVAFDRAVKAVQRSGLDGHMARWERLRGTIREEVLGQGFNTKVGSFVQYYGAEEPDASLLMLPLVGFISPTDPRMLGTVRFVQERLVNDGFVYRYRPSFALDGLEGEEGAFLVCSFWLADNLAMQGRAEEAAEIVERVLAVSSDVGLLSEEYDTRHQRLVGNFPQAFSHVGLINTARNLAAPGGPAESRRESEPPAPQA